MADDLTFKEMARIGRLLEQITDLTARLEKAERALSVAREALEFYADDSNWDYGGVFIGNLGELYMNQVAEQALKEIGETK